MRPRTSFTSNNPVDGNYYGSSPDAYKILYGAPWTNAQSKRNHIDTIKKTEKPKRILSPPLPLIKISRSSTTIVKPVDIFGKVVRSIEHQRFPEREPEPMLQRQRTRQLLIYHMLHKVGILELVIGYIRTV